MEVGKGGAGAKQAEGGLSALFKAAFAERPAILPSAFVNHNLGIGLFLCLGAVLLLANPQVGSAQSALALAAVGLILSAGFLVNRLRPAALPRTLALHGALLALLAVCFALGALRWALWAPALSSFHYLPGVALVLSVYGALQLAEFGYWPASSRRIRLLSVWFGITLELGVLVGFVVRLLSNP